MAIVAPVAPSTVSPLPTPPSTSSPADFDAKADSFLGALPTNQSQMNELGTNVYQNALKTYNSSNDTTTNATNAANSASSANNSAITASTAASNANNSYSEMQKLYLGSKTSSPTVDNQGQPLQKGVWYTNTTTGQWFWWNGSTWILGVGDLTTVNWNTQVTNKPTTLAGYGITDAVSKTETLPIASGGTGSTTAAGALGALGGVSLGTAQEISAVKGFAAGVASRKGIGIGRDLSTSAYLNRRCLQFSTDVSFPNVNYDDHPAMIMYATMPGEFGSGSLTFAVATNFGVYNTASPCFIIRDSGVTSKGDITAFSDERLKHDWKPVCSNFLKGLADSKSGTYSRKDTRQRQAGVSAQDLQKILPEAVSVVNEETGFLGVDYGKAALVSSVELARKVLELETKIEKMECLIESITNKLQMENK